MIEVFPVLYVLIGPAGSGKSTIAEQMKERMAVRIVSTDEIRQNMFGSAEDQRNGSEVFDRAYNMIRDHINHRRNVVFDATNTTKKGREELLRRVNMKKNPFHKIAVIVMTDIDGCKRQNLMRDRKVPESVIERQMEQFWRDAQSIENQFDAVYVV